MRAWVISVAFAVLSAGALASEATVAPQLAHADDETRDLAPGVQLMATDNVTLQRAEIAKGSKVSVNKLLVREGRVDGVNLELADGHVVKVPLSTVRNFFKVVE